jgi:hypothetical protein
MRKRNYGGLLLVAFLTFIGVRGLFWVCHDTALILDSRNWVVSWIFAALIISTGLLFYPKRIVHHGALVLLGFFVLFVALRALVTHRIHNRRYPDITREKRPVNCWITIAILFAAAFGLLFLAVFDPN